MTQWKLKTSMSDFYAGQTHIEYPITLYFKGNLKGEIY